MKRCWLVKSEEDVYPLTALEQEGRTPWTGIRNYEARNVMRDLMQEGDPVLFYHSNASPPGVVGVAQVRGRPYPDPTQFLPDDPAHDPTSKREEPRWWLVDLAFVEAFPRKVTLPEIREDPALAEMALLKRSRLSVQPVTPAEFDRIRELARS